MQNDENFGYAFASYDQTLLAGGHGLATECEQGQEENLDSGALAAHIGFNFGPKTYHQALDSQQKKSPIA